MGFGALSAVEADALDANIAFFLLLLRGDFAGNASCTSALRVCHIVITRLQVGHVGASLAFVWAVVLLIVIVVGQLHIRLLVAGYLHVADGELVLMAEFKSSLLGDTSFRTSALQ